MTLRGLVLPGEARLPEERTTEEQLSIPVLHLAAQLVRRMLLDLPRATRKLAVLDEAHALTRDPAGRSQVLELARDSRKNNVCAIVVSQNPGRPAGRRDREPGRRRVRVPHRRGRG